MPNRFWLVAGAIAAFAIVLLSREYVLLPDGHFHAYICDVGQGDAILLQSPGGRHILIDGGPDLSLLRCLGQYLPYFNRTLDLLVLTHPDDDHITALPEVLRRYVVKEALLTGVRNPSGPSEAFFAEMEKRHIPTLHPKPREIIDFGDGLALELLWPDMRHLNAEVNATSIVLRASAGSGAILLTGDLPATSEASLLATGQDVASSVLKVAHHGSKTSTSSGFLLAVRPSLAIISVGKGNKFGHPAPETLGRLRSLQTRIHTTEEEGTIELLF